MPSATEPTVAFPCFGSQCAVLVAPSPRSQELLDSARAQLLSWHGRFTRFEADSELSRLNRDRRRVVPVSAVMARFARAAVEVARQSGGLVDPTMVRAVEQAGYRTDLGAPVPLAVALALAPPRRPGEPHPSAPWREIAADPARRTVTRPVGVALDSGGVAKGLFADLLADRLRDHGAYAVDCGGDLRLGGALRPVNVASPFDGATLHTLEQAEGAVATSGIGRRSWLGPDGRPGHHLLDPATGRPAFTGVVQATAVAPTAVEAEMRAKAALLSGPAGAPAWLAHGGVLVGEDGGFDVIAPAPSRARPTTSAPGRI